MIEDHNNVNFFKCHGSVFDCFQGTDKTRQDSNLTKTMDYLHKIYK